MKLREARGADDPPTLAILIPYHNEGALLTRCLNSLRDQSTPVDEILIYDDASSLPPEPYIPQGLPVRVVRGAVNIGPGRGRNILLRQTRARFIHFHDADDSFAPGWAGSVLTALTNDSLDAVFTDISFANDLGIYVDRMLGLDAIHKGQDLVSFCIRGVMLTPAGTYRRDIVDAIGGYREALWQSEDWDFHIRLAARGIHFDVLPEPLVVMHRRPDSRSEERREVLDSTLQAIRLLASEIPARYQKDLSEVAAHAGSVLFRLGAHSDARAAFRLARRLGPATLESEPYSYRVLSQIAGQECAEWVGYVYRRTLPSSLRNFMASLPMRRAT